jgi:tRNA uridine 5-carboxymethylaminomethyl modification enzyme
MGLGSRLIYVNGLSTSMPRTAQVEMVRSLPGCSRAVIASWGYAVEYSWLPRGMDASCRSVTCPNLFLAGQVCGTSGYEEAAALGLVAGRNAAAEALGMPGFVPDAASSYLGVMAHDIAERDFDEPYRLFSSRALNRMHLRPDNALRRLLRTAVGNGLGRPGDAEAADRLEVRGRELAEGLGRTVLEGRSLAAMCRTPGYDPDLAADALGLTGEDDRELLRSLALDLRYEGYMDRALRRAAEAKRLSGLVLGIEDFSLVAGVSTEARQALQAARPRTLAEASAVPAVRPADVEGLLVHVSRRGVRRSDG